jgi:hypothetical protein
MKYYILLLLFVIKNSTACSQETQIRQTIDSMFEAMYVGDTATMRTFFTPGANLLTYKFDSKGNPRAKGETLNDFLRGVGLTGEIEMEEKITGWQCLIDDGIASVWAPYEFYYEGKFNHCGVNSFQLILVQGSWKITLITDSRRNDNCVSTDVEKVKIDSLINAWHHAASTADEETFFGLMTSDAVYIGTDASERWLRDELMEWAKDYFQKETAWDFKPLARHITIGPGEHIAWFDELLDTWMGTCRSTGIMSKTDGHWKLVYYHLSVAIPNESIGDYVKLLDQK